MGVVHWMGTFLAFGAMALLVVVSVSAPIWDSVYFLKAADNVRLGNWGYCLAQGCSGTNYGYNPSAIFGLSNGGNNGIINTDGNGINFNFGNDNLTYALILHPIAAGIAAIAVLFGLFPFLPCGILGSITAFLAFLVAAVALIIDLVLFIRLRNDLRDNGVSAMLGNAIWMVVAATAALLVASLFICFTRGGRKNRKSDDVYAAEAGEPRRRGFLGFGGRRNHVNDPYVADGTAGAPVMAEKRHFWQRKRAAPATY